MSASIQRWWASLKPGDKLRVRFPWQDAKVPGGRVVTATVRSIGRYSMMDRYGKPYCKTRLIQWRGGQAMMGCYGDCYIRPMPIDRDTIYSAKHGIIMARRRG